MKKLLVIALSAILVLGMAAMVMADPAVTFKGEIDDGFDTTHSTSATGGQVTVDAAINNNVSFTSEFTFGGFEQGFGPAGFVAPPNSNAVGAMDNYSVNC